MIAQREELCAERNSTLPGRMPTEPAKVDLAGSQRLGQSPEILTSAPTECGQEDERRKVRKAPDLEPV